MDIKYSKDTRKHPQWEPVLQIQRPMDKSKPNWWLVFTWRFGWITLESCSHIRNGDFAELKKTATYDHGS
jgi:hypothetical protein